MIRVKSTEYRRRVRVQYKVSMIQYKVEYDTIQGRVQTMYLTE